MTISACAASGSPAPSTIPTATPDASPTARPHPSEPPWGHRAPGVTGFTGRIAFSHNDGATSASSVYVLDGGGPPRRLTDDDSFPVIGGWSPDGRSLALSRTVCPAAPNRCAAIISIVEVATGHVTDVTKPVSGVLDLRPTFSPDGRRLLFSSTRAVNDVDGMNLFTVGIDGSSMAGIPIDATTADLATWSPDGASIRYSEWSGAEPPQVYEIRPDGSGRHALDALAALGIGTAAWAPTAAAVAYTADSILQPVSPTEYVTTPEIWASAPVGTPGRALVPWPWHGGVPAWSPDGRSIAFVGGPPGVDGLFIVGLDGAEPKRVSTSGIVPSDTPIAWTLAAGR